MSRLPTPPLHSFFVSPYPHDDPLPHLLHHHLSSSTLPPPLVSAFSLSPSSLGISISELDGVMSIQQKCREFENERGECSRNNRNNRNEGNSNFDGYGCTFWRSEVEDAEYNDHS